MHENLILGNSSLMLHYVPVDKLFTVNHSTKLRSIYSSLAEATRVKKRADLYQVSKTERMIFKPVFTFLRYENPFTI